MQESNWTSNPCETWSPWYQGRAHTSPIETLAFMIVELLEILLHMSFLCFHIGGISALQRWLDQVAAVFHLTTLPAFEGRGDGHLSIFSPTLKSPSPSAAAHVHLLPGLCSSRFWKWLLRVKSSWKSLWAQLSRKKSGPRNASRISWSLPRDLFTAVRGSKYC